MLIFNQNVTTLNIKVNISTFKYHLTNLRHNTSREKSQVQYLNTIFTPKQYS